MVWRMTLRSSNSSTTRRPAKSLLEIGFTWIYGIFLDLLDDLLWYFMETLANCGDWIGLKWWFNADLTQQFCGVWLSLTLILDGIWLTKEWDFLKADCAWDGMFGTSNGDLGDFMASHHGFNLGFHSLNSTVYLWIHGLMVILAEENGAGLKLLAAIKKPWVLPRFLYAASMVLIPWRFLSRNLLQCGAPKIAKLVYNSNK